MSKATRRHMVAKLFEGIRDEVVTLAEELDEDIALQAIRPLPAAAALERWFETVRATTPVETWPAALDRLLADLAREGITLSREDVRMLRRWIERAQAEVPVLRPFPPKGVNRTPVISELPQAAYVDFRGGDQIVGKPPDQVWWSSRTAGEPLEFYIGTLINEPTRTVAVAEFWGGYEVLALDLIAAAMRLNVAAARDAIGLDPKHAIHSVILALRDNGLKHRTKLQREEAERQRLEQEAMDRLERDPDKIRRYMAPRVEHRPDDSTRILGPMDDEVRRQMHEGGTAGPISASGFGGEPIPLTDEEALHGTAEEFMRAVRAEIQAIVAEEREAKRTTLDRILDPVEHLVDLLSLIPIAGVPFDLAAAGISALRGDQVGVALALLGVTVDAAALARIYRRLANRMADLRLPSRKVADVRAFADRIQSGAAQRQVAGQIADAIASNPTARTRALEEVLAVHPSLTRKQAEEVLDALVAVGRAGQESGLMVVFRRNMPLRLAKDKQGQQVPIFGSSKSSSETTGHAAAIDRIAQEFAESGDYAYVVIGDRSWRTATGRVATSTKRPDVVGVRRNGKVDSVEVRSRHDTKEQLTRRQDEGLQSLPHRRRGKPDVRDP